MRALLVALGLAVAGGCAGPALHVYWGDLHGHTALSDGKGSPEEYFRYARKEAGLDFVAVTDHDFGHGPPWRLSAEEWRHLQDAADAATEDGAFVAFAGWEWTSQPKYWAGHAGGEGLFPGVPRHFNHKVVLPERRTPEVFSAKDAATSTPEGLARAVRAVGGVILNAHPTAGEEGRDQWAYPPADEDLFANTEIGPDVVRWQGKTWTTDLERTVFAFLATGRRTGLVADSDTHEGRPAAHTAVRARALTRAAILDALRHRRCWAVTYARILLDVRVAAAGMGEEVAVRGAPAVFVEVAGTAPLAEVALLRNGEVIRRERSATPRLRFTHVDAGCGAEAWYVVRVTQADADPEGNPSRAWSSPIWVRRSG